MKKIFLCCAAGMSTSMVVNKMKQAAAQKGIEAEIIAVAMEEFDATLSKFDCCLLGPQIKYKFDEFKKKADAADKPIAVINSMDYGMMRGDKILADALAMMA
jgi:PTS system cellobiose-specific IIB component